MRNLDVRFHEREQPPLCANPGNSDGHFLPPPDGKELLDVSTSLNGKDEISRWIVL